MSDTLEKLKGNLIKDEREFSFSEDVEYIGLYFSALWCPPCRGFTPKLVEFYKKVAMKGHKFEIVFVSSDTDEDTFEKYYKDMPWAALKFDQKESKELLTTKYNVRGFPTLVILDKTGRTVTTGGRSCVLKKTGDEDVLQWE